MGIANKKILVTCGPTWVPVDDVRVISNTSSGILGQICANVCRDKGARVTLLEGPGTERIPLSSEIRRKRFFFLSDLERLLTKELRAGYDVVIHAAAVSDFKLKRPIPGKTTSRTKQLTLTLVPTRKLINMIKRTSPGCFLVGFKLEPSYRKALLLEKARTLIHESGADAVVANALKPGYRAFIVRRDGSTTETVKSKSTLVKQLIRDVDTYL